MSSNELESKKLLDKMFHAELLFMHKNDDREIEKAFHPDIIVHEPDSLPYAGEWRGYQQLKQLWNLMSKCWESITVEDMNIIINDLTIFLNCKLTAKARKSGKIITSPFAQPLNIEDGLVKDVIPFYYDTVVINQALEHSPKNSSIYKAYL